MQKKFSLSSMTAYGSGEALSQAGRFSAEIQSVNRRYLEININLPQVSPSLDAQLRTLLGEKLSRGQIHLTLNWQRTGSLGIKPNLALAQELKKGWEAIAAELELDVPFDLKLLMNERELFITEGGDLPLKPILEAVETALEGLLEMRAFEGKKLAQDLDSRLTFLEERVAEIEKANSGNADRFKEKLAARLGELVKGTEHEERILREVALLAEKADVTEEIVRFKIHAQKFRMTMEEGGACGKKLDFLLQELIRESNTMGAKGQLVVEIKSQLEKMREQVQNVE